VNNVLIHPTKPTTIKRKNLLGNKSLGVDFRWIDEGHGQGRITNGSETVAEFYSCPDSMQTPLRKSIRPVSLHNVRFSPGGESLIGKNEHCGPICLSWRKALVYQMEIADFSVDQSDPNRLVIRLRMRDVGLRADQPGVGSYRAGNLEELTELVVGYEAASRGYYFDIETQVRVLPERLDFVLAHCPGGGGLEFGDLLPYRANDQFPPLGEKRYTHLVYLSEEGKLLNRPQNKHLGPDKNGIRFAPNGFLAFAAEDAGNPALQFREGCGHLAESDICWAMYDVHFRLRADKQEALLKDGQSVQMKFRIHALSREQSATMLAESVLDPVYNNGLSRAPAFADDGINRFEPSGLWSVPSDRWFWQASDPCCTWSLESGWNTGGVLKIERPEVERPAAFPGCLWTRLSPFSCAGETRSQWEFHRLPPSLRYRVRAKVRTQDVVGSCYIAFGCARQRISGSSPHVLVKSPLALEGTCGWMDLEVGSPQIPPDDVPLLSLYLVLEGKGECWFDEVAVEVVEP